MHANRGPLVNPPRTLRRAVLVAFAMSIAVFGCGGGDAERIVASGEPQPSTQDVGDGTQPTTAAQEANPATDDLYPVTVAHDGGELTLDARPERIVSLSATATEMLFAIGAGDQVIAVDDQSTYPPEAPMTTLSGFAPNVEAIVGFEPDLVISVGLPEELEKALGAAGIPSMVAGFAVTVEDTYTQMERIGAATGHLGEAVEAVGVIRTRLDEIAAGVDAETEPLTYYHELDNLYYSATSNTFIGQVYSTLGLVNIADGAEAGNDFPQLSAEYILEADPDLIFLADTKCCGESIETVTQRPGWAELSAVQGANVIAVDDDIASRWGPRIVDFLEVVIDATAKVRVDAPG